MEDCQLREVWFMHILEGCIAMCVSKEFVQISQKKQFLLWLHWLNFTSLWVIVLQACKWGLFSFLFVLWQEVCNRLGTYLYDAVKGVCCTLNAIRFNFSPSFQLNIIIYVCKTLIYWSTSVMNIFMKWLVGSSGLAGIIVSCGNANSYHGLKHA